MRAIVTRDRNDATTLRKKTSLLRYDSIHGDFQVQLLLIQTIML
jgi:glyceraldehyde 3-phosphate dehydrogenase